MPTHIKMLTGSEGGEPRDWIVGEPVADPQIRLCACPRGMVVDDAIAEALQDPANEHLLRGRTFEFTPVAEKARKGAAKTAQDASAGGGGGEKKATEPVAGAEPPNPTLSAATSSGVSGAAGPQI